MKLQISAPKGLKLILMLITLSLLVTGCSQASTDESDNVVHEPAATAPNSTDLAAGERPHVVATTNIVADVVKQVGGKQIDLVSLIPVGADPHSFNPTPQDLIALNDAHIIFVNGLHLEEALDPVLDSLERNVAVVSVNAGVETIKFGADEHGDDEHRHEEGNPHTWFSIRAVEQWTDNIEEALSELDPANAERYTANATTFREGLAALEAELTAQVAEIPAAERKLVTDHGTLDYLAREFDFEVIGAVIPGLSPMAAPSARDLAKLHTQIDAEALVAIFVGNTVNSGSAQQIAADTDVQIVPIYTGSLSDDDGPAATYLDFMRYNVSQIVEALK